MMPRCSNSPTGECSARTLQECLDLGDHSPCHVPQHVAPLTDKIAKGVPTTKRRQMARHPE